MTGALTGDCVTRCLTGLMQGCCDDFNLLAAALGEETVGAGETVIVSEQIRINKIQITYLSMLAVAGGSQVGQAEL